MELGRPPWITSFASVTPRLSSPSNQPFLRCLACLFHHFAIICSSLFLQQSTHIMTQDYTHTHRHAHTHAHHAHIHSAKVGPKAHEVTYILHRPEGRWECQGCRWECQRGCRWEWPGVGPEWSVGRGHREDAHTLL
jgi:hypothetical protein